MRSFLVAALALALSCVAAKAEPVRIVMWNMGATSAEGLTGRLDAIGELASELQPDVLVLVEVAGNMEAKMIASSLGWPSYRGITSNFGTHPNAYYALELAVISKIPIESVTEHDSRLDRKNHGSLFHPVFSESGDVDAATAPVAEMDFAPENAPIFGFANARQSRGTMRVDLENGLTIFPVHLKSSAAWVCEDLKGVKAKLRAARKVAQASGGVACCRFHGHRV